jgi:hypothetical protein
VQHTFRETGLSTAGILELRAGVAVDPFHFLPMRVVFAWRDRIGLELANALILIDFRHALARESFRRKDMDAGRGH